MQLNPNTLLQGGKYKIIRVLGQGIFGITYEAVHVALGHIVAVKEFFMVDYCMRDAATSYVSIPAQTKRELVENYRGKFIREAKMLAFLSHRSIVRLTDLFDENGTSYYVMDFLPGGSLADKVKRQGHLSEEQAERYIRQVADALVYIHRHNTLCTRVSPSNILLNDKDEAVLTGLGFLWFTDLDDCEAYIPVSYAKGFVPLEVECCADVSKLSPSSDIYSLGATLYYLVSGLVPPDASFLFDEGLPRPKEISDRMWQTIELSMRVRRAERPQSISEFLSLL